jgi:diguanylate cyclase (GGDEF)-like protein
MLGMAMKKEPLPRVPEMVSVQDFSGLPAESDEELFILNFGSRLLTAFSNKGRLVTIALETIADFSRGRRVALFTLDADSGTLCTEGIFADSKPRLTEAAPPLPESLLYAAMMDKMVRTYGLKLDEDRPLPVAGLQGAAPQCLCMPLVGSDFQAIGIATIELDQKNSLSFHDMQQLRILTTVLAISLENAALFAQVLYDGLTGLYVRRYHEIRLEEELARLRRQEGFLAFIMLDLDRFKAINDRFGHQSGDIILQEFAHMLKNTVRQGSTVLSRFGGDEFTVLLPGATGEEAARVAERVRRACERYAFSFQMRVTVSCGVASTSSDDVVPAGELFRRADTMLYEAKEAGRNRTRKWGSSQR